MSLKIWAGGKRGRFPHHRMFACVCACDSVCFSVLDFFLCESVCVWVSFCVWLSDSLCVSVWVCFCVWVCVCVSEWMCVFMCEWVYVCFCVWVCVFLCVYVCEWVYCVFFVLRVCILCFSLETDVNRMNFVDITFLNYRIKLNNECCFIFCFLSLFVQNLFGEIFPKSGP